MAATATTSWGKAADKPTANGTGKGNGSTLPPIKKEDQKPTTPAAASNVPTSTPNTTNMTPRERYLAEKAKNGGITTNATAVAQPPQDAVLALVQELLKAGGFSRRLTWKERRALRAIERACDRVRNAVHEAFDKQPDSVARAIDGFAALEAICRFELLKAPLCSQTKK